MTQFEKIVFFMKKPVVIALYALAVIAAYLFLDRSLAIYLHQADLGTKVPLLEALTALGKWIAYLALFFIAGLYFRYLKKNPLYEARAWYLFACVFTANFLCAILKIVLSRARPELLFASNEFGFFWFKLSGEYWSFPSGHTTTVVSLAIGLGVLFPRYFNWLLGLAFLVALSRILLCFHYLSDVMSAFYITILVVGFFTEYFRRQIGSKKWRLVCGLK